MIKKGIKKKAGRPGRPRKYKTKTPKNKKKRPVPSTEERLATPSMHHLGELTIYKGFMDQIKLAVWDAVPQCTPDCILHESCPFTCPDNIDISDTRKCEIKTRYLNSTMRSLKKIVKQKNAKNVHIIGMMLMPLYNQLVTFKMNEFKIAHNNNAMQGAHVHPIYKEIRGTMKTILDILDKIDAETDNDTLTNGDSSYYQDLFENGEVPYE